MDIRKNKKPMGFENTVYVSEDRRDQLLSRPKNLTKLIPRSHKLPHSELNSSHAELESTLI
tara:strand:- start:385 stop:567 length:183 start_codon:yes stop_codon:yes gene_type:complete